MERRAREARRVRDREAEAASLVQNAFFRRRKEVSFKSSNTTEKGREGLVGSFGYSYRQNSRADRMLRHRALEELISFAYTVMKEREEKRCAGIGGYKAGGVALLEHRTCSPWCCGIEAPA